MVCWPKIFEKGIRSIVQISDNAEFGTIEEMCLDFRIARVYQAGFSLARPSGQGLRKWRKQTIKRLKTVGQWLNERMDGFAWYHIQINGDRFKRAAVILAYLCCRFPRDLYTIDYAMRTYDHSWHIDNYFDVEFRNEIIVELLL